MLNINVSHFDIGFDVLIGILLFLSMIEYWIIFVHIKGTLQSDLKLLRFSLAIGMSFLMSHYLFYLGMQYFPEQENILMRFGDLTLLLMMFSFAYGGRIAKKFFGLFDF